MHGTDSTLAARDDLRLLALFHYLIAALAGFFALLPVVYVGMALAADIDPFASNLHLAAVGRPPDRQLVAAALAAVALFVCAAGVGVAGRCVRAGRHLGFCQAMAFVAMPFLPFGTLLGIWSLVVLARSDVKAVFAGPEPRGS